MIINRFKRLHPPDDNPEGETIHLLVLIVQSPPTPSEGRLYDKIMEKVACPFRHNDSPGRKQFQVITVLRRVGLRMLIIDEIHHVLAGSLRQPLDRAMDMRKIVSFLFAFLLLSGLVFPQTTKVASSAERRGLLSYLNSHWKSPEEYVVSKFAKFDLVLIGEPHWVRQHVTLVGGLIPQLHKRGVNILAIEFARRIDQPLIDSLLNAPVYDEKLARRITMQGLVQWGYQEYVDLYKAAWQVNRKLQPGAPRFRILALNGSPDYSVIKKREDVDNWQVRRVALHGETEKDWATLLIDSVLAKNQKALVYCGTHHAFTKYAQPIVSDGKLVRKEDSRFGQHLHAYAPTRIFMIALHSPWPGADGYGSPLVPPADGIIDETLESAGKKWRRIGFDLNGTPFGALVSQTSVYKHGYEPFTLDEFADGYIYVGPISRYEPVTTIADFIDDSNIE